MKRLGPGEGGMAADTTWSDEPIRTAKDDQLGRAVFAGRLAEIIARRMTKDPLVIALSGRWGDGKTSILNILHEALATDPSLLIVRHEPWFFTSVESLLDGFFSDIYSAFNRGSFIGRWFSPADWQVRKGLLQVNKVLRPAASLGGVNVDLDPILRLTPARERDALVAALEKSGRRAVVLIDDLDRLPPEEMVLILKLIRLCSVLPWFTFVLAFDRHAVSAALKKRFDTEDDYLEKIIQLDVQVPPVDRQAMLGIARQGLDVVGRSVDVNLEPITKKIFGRAVLGSLGVHLPVAPGPDDRLRTLRDMKRFLNAVAATLPLVVSEVDPEEFVMLEFLRTFYPEAYQFAYEARHDLTARRLALDAGYHSKRPTERFKAEAVRLRAAGASIAVDVLSDLFPRFASAAADVGGVDATTRLLAISNPEYVDGYFLLSVPSGSVSTAVIVTLLSSLSPDVATCERVLRAAIDEHTRDDRAPRFFRALNRNMDASSISRETAESGAIALAHLSGSLGSEEAYDSIAAAARNTMIALFDKVDPARRQSAFVRAVEEASSLEFGALLAALASNEHYRVVGEWKQFDQQPIVACAKARIAASFKSSNDLISNPRWWTLLRIWAQPSEAAACLVATCAHDANRWRDVANACVDPGAFGGMHDDQSAMAVGGLAGIVDLDVLLDALPIASTDSVVAAFVRCAALGPQLRRDVVALRDAAVALARDGSIGSDVTPWRSALDRDRDEVARWLGRLSKMDALDALHADWTKVGERWPSKADLVGGTEQGAKAVARLESCRAAVADIATRADTVASELPNAYASLPPVLFEMGYPNRSAGP